MTKFRTKLQKALFSMFLISTIIVGGMSVPSIVKAAPIKIMPVGDSCTEGMGDPDMGSYRTELYKLYKNAGLEFDFVGSNQRGPSSLPDKDNEGHSGWTIPQVASNIDGWLNTQNPDVVFLWIGGNDIFQTGKINTSGLSNLIDQIFRTKPNVKIFVADYYPNPDNVTQYNATIPGVVQEKANAGKAVYFVKLSSMGYVKSADTSSDGLHLNTNGYKKAAQVWYDSTISILKGSGSTQPTQQPGGWTQPTAQPTQPGGWTFPGGWTQPTAQPTQQPGGWTQPTSPVSSTGTIKIMPVGDSCTEGMGDPDMGSYRTELYRLYKNAGLNFDFVGSNQRGPSSLPDKDNEGHSGWTIPQVASNIDGWLNTQNPDVVFLWIGGNDIFQTGKINTSGLSNLIDQIFRTKPNVKIFVADYYPNPDNVVQYNATIPGVVQEKANAGKAVYFVKLSDMGYVKSADTSSDGLHLNTNGYKKAAQVWYDSTISILKGSNINTPVPPTQTIAPVLKGDVDGDGSVTSLDFGYMRKYILGMIPSFPSANGLKAADINDDGDVNALDFAGVRLILLGK